MDIMDIRVITVIKDITDIMVITDIRNYAECGEDNTVKVSTIRALASKIGRFLHHLHTKI